MNTTLINQYHVCVRAYFILPTKPKGLDGLLGADRNVSIKRKVMVLHREPTIHGIIKLVSLFDGKKRIIAINDIRQINPNHNDGRRRT
jgi:hypothetical protein